MKIRDLGEFPFLRRLRARLPHASLDPRIQLGVGDDCAALSLPGLTVLTTDAMIAGVHFQCEWAPFFVLGQKAFAVNASDVAAMGGEPAFALLSLGVPQDSAVEDLDAFFDGFLEAAQQMRTTLIGGNMSAAPVLMISVALLGQTPHGPIARSGARVADEVYVTGTLGDAALGLRILTGELAGEAESLAAQHLKQRFLCPTARVTVGKELAAQDLATAMIDVSDGLLQDLGHLCEASQVGAVVEAHRLPLSEGYRTFLGAQDWVPALAGGEDYELLFSATVTARPRIQHLADQSGCAITRIGSLVPQAAGVTVRLPDGPRAAGEFTGFNHFAQSRP